MNIIWKSQEFGTDLTSKLYTTGLENRSYSFKYCLNSNELFITHTNLLWFSFPQTVWEWVQKNSIDSYETLLHTIGLGRSTIGT